MRRIVFSVAMLAVALTGFAQKKNVSGAENALYEPTESSLKEAVTKIEAAMKDLTTANEAKTYYVAGQVYYKIYEEEEKKKMLNQSFNQKVKDEYLVKAIDAFAKAAELDQLPDEKGKIKPKYTKELTKHLQTYSPYLINEGLANYESKNHKNAVTLWEKYLETYSYPLLVAAGTKKDTLYHDIKYYSMSAAMSVPEFGKKVILFMEELNDANYGAILSKRDETGKTPPSIIYQWIFDQHKANNDTVKFVKTLQAGIKKYPSDMYLMGNLINYYLQSEKTDEAITYLDNAIKNDPKNPQYYAIKGDLFNRKKDFESAIAQYSKAIEIDPSFALAQAGLGLVYVTQAEEIFNAAGAIKDNKKYEAERQRAKGEFAKALPFLEKARELDPRDADNLRVLRAAYLRLDRGKDYEKIDAELKAL